MDANPCWLRKRPGPRAIQHRDELGEIDHRADPPAVGVVQIHIEKTVRRRLLSVLQRHMS